ncbi:MAG: PD40 domain-containing protein [Chromatiales bacterium]|nr:MAG: PD40 domain-containing protein [Chromatiales bacterium]
MQRKPHRLLAGCALAFSLAAQAQTVVTLQEGTDMRVSANTDASRLSFDLAGLIWMINGADGNARSLTEPQLLARRPALSPDGERIVFDAGVPGRRQLWAVDADGGTPQQLTFGAYDHHSAVWHPDGRRVAFVSNRGGDLSIWELEPDSLDLRQRSFSTGDEREPAYSASGELLAYVSAVGDGDALYIVGEDGRSERVVTSRGRLHVPSWRPDGSLLTFVQRTPGVSELRIAILSDPPVVKPLTRGENVLTSPALWLDTQQFIYAADGRIRRRRFDDFHGTDMPFQARLAVPRARVAAGAANIPTAEARPVRGITGMAQAGDRRFVTALGDLWELDASGSVVRKLTTAPFVDTQLTGAPNGSHLAFVSDRGDGFQVWLARLDDGALRALTTEPGAAFYPAWRPDSGAIAYLAEPHPDARNLSLKIIDITSAEARTLARGLPDTARPQWLPDGTLTVQFAQGGRLAFNEDATPAALPITSGPVAEYVSPVGAHVATLAGGRLTVARVVGAERLQEAVTVAEAHAARPQWIDGGKLLAWLGPSGPMTWSADGGDVRPMPVALTWRAAQPPAERRLVIRTGRLFDGLGPDYEFAQDIVIVGNRIEAIGPWRDPPPGELLDARDLTVLPGLLDLAVQPRRPRSQLAGRAWLAWGVTGVREFARDPATSIERRESWASGQRPGPRLFPVMSACTAPNALTTTQRLAAVAIAVCADQGGAERAETIQRAGVEGLNTIAVDPFPGSLLGAREIPLRGPIGETIGYPDAANRFVYGDVIEVAGAAGLTSVSTLSAIGLPGLLAGSDLTMDSRVEALLRPGELGWYRQSWQAQANAFSTALRAEARTAGQSLFRAVGRGARIVAGSGAPSVPAGLGLHAELRLLRQTGLQPFQVLRMATLDAAEAIGAGDAVGAIRPGLLADLVLVRGDPLKDIDDAANVEMTVINGRVYTRSGLMSGPGVGKFYSP